MFFHNHHENLTIPSYLGHGDFYKKGQFTFLIHSGQLKLLYYIK